MNKEDERLGALCLFMPKSKSFEKDVVFEIVAQQLGLAIQKNEAQQIARLEAERYQSLTENLPGVVYRCKYDRHWTMIYASRELKRLSGYSADEIVENRVRSYASLIHPDDAPMVDDCIGQAAKKNMPWEIDYRIIHKDGSTRWVREKGRFVAKQDTSSPYLDGFIYDITENKTKKLALQESEVLNRSIVNAIPDIIFKTNKDGVYIDVIASDEKKLYTSKEELIGRSIKQWLPENVAMTLLDALQKAFLTNKI